MQTKPLRVAALGMEQRTYNTLQLFFSDRCDDHYVLSDENSADIFIIDMDGYQAAKVLEVARKNHPDQPAILISLSDQQSSDAVFVRKPIQLSALTSALTEAQQRIVRSKPAVSNLVRANSVQPKAVQANIAKSNVAPLKSVQAGAGFSTAAKNTTGHHKVQGIANKSLPAFNNTDQLKKQNNTGNPASAAKVKYYVNKDRLRTIQETHHKNPAANDSQQIKLDAEPRVKPRPLPKSSLEFQSSVNDSGIMFVGDLQARFNPKNSKQIAKMQYKSEMTLQGYFSLAYSIAQTSQSNVVLKGPWRPIVILYQSKEVCVEKNFRHLYALSNMTFKKEEVSIYGQQEDVTSMMSDLVVVQPIEQFLWKLALRTSRGRIPEGTDLHTPVKLNRWPNFTRCDVTPHALRIAALWAKQPTSLVDTAEQLAIPQQYIFAFYSAAQATNLVTFDSESKQRNLIPQFTQRHKHRNLFQSLLDRLRHF